MSHKNTQIDHPVTPKKIEPSLQNEDGVVKIVGTYTQYIKEQAVDFISNSMKPFVTAYEYVTKPEETNEGNFRNNFRSA